MSTILTHPLQVERVAIATNSPAWQLAMRSWSENDRRAVEETAADGPACPLVLVEARRGAILAGAVLGQIVPGRAAIVWPPQLVEPQPLFTSAALLDQLCADLAARGVILAQSILSAESLLQIEHLQTGGFTQLADLLYLSCERSLFPASPPKLSLELVPVSASDELRLIETIDRTYVGTQDCPQLDGTRTTIDVLEGYRGVGVHRPELWFLLRDQGQDVGCLIVGDHPETQQWELIYLGLVPEVRGRGWGRQVVEQLLWLANKANRERVVLAVDAANRPALQTYAAANFGIFDRRTVYWKLLNHRPSEAETA